MITAGEQRETLLALYPLFKEEVFRRREQIMRWTAIGAGSMVAILMCLILLPDQGQRSFSGRALIAGSILLLAATFIALILQQRHRHHQAKQTLIELEQALGLFDPDIFSSRRSLYPDHWQTDWRRDHSTTFAVILLGLLTLLALAATALTP